MTTERFSIKKRLQSFRLAFAGLVVLIREEHNARIHLVAAVFAIVLGVSLKIRVMEWCAVVLAIGLVFAAELFNSSIEKLCDHVTPERHAVIKKVKDLSAAGVLICALAALVIGVFIFAPKLIQYVNNF